MPKKNATQFWLNSDLVKALEEKKNAQGRVEGMATYIETILNQFILGHLVHVDIGTGRKAILEAKMRLVELLKFMQYLEQNERGLLKSLRGQKGPADLRVGKVGQFEAGEGLGQLDPDNKRAHPPKK